MVGQVVGRALGSNETLCTLRTNLAQNPTPDAANWGRRRGWARGRPERLRVPGAEGEGSGGSGFQLNTLYPTIRLTGGAEGAASRRGQGTAGQVEALRAVRAMGAVGLGVPCAPIKPTIRLGAERAASRRDGRTGCACLVAGAEGGEGGGDGVGCEGFN